MHKANPHSNRYDFDKLVVAKPELKTYMVDTPKGDKSIDFSNDEAVKCLNAALLKQFYNIENWGIPKNYLCPGVPGRADYLFYINDLLEGKKSVRVLDIGTGANCIYPLIGAAHFGWNFVATEIDELAVSFAKKNSSELNNLIDVRLQNNPAHMFTGVIKPSEKFDVVICNPPFYRSKDEAVQNTRNKNTGLKKMGQRDTRNFGGMHKEVWCKGGERAFVSKLIFESSKQPQLATWFTSLVSQKDNLSFLKKELSRFAVAETKTIEMEQGSKKSRILAWRF